LYKGKVRKCRHVKWISNINGAKGGLGNKHRSFSLKPYMIKCFVVVASFNLVKTPPPPPLWRPSPISVILVTGRFKSLF